MGVTILHQMLIGDNRTGPQVIEHLTKRIVAMGATQAGHFLVDCETYTSVQSFAQSIGTPEQCCQIMLTQNLPREYLSNCSRFKGFPSNVFKALIKIFCAAEPKPRIFNRFEKILEIFGDSEIAMFGNAVLEQLSKG